MGIRDKGPNLQELSRFDILLLKSRKSTIPNFRTDFLVKNNPRRVRRRLAQRLYPVQRARHKTNILYFDPNTNILTQISNILTQIPNMLTQIPIFCPKYPFWHLLTSQMMIFQTKNNVRKYRTGMFLDQNPPILDLGTGILIPRPLRLFCSA